MKDSILLFLKDLRDQIIQVFEAFESNEKFQRKNWDHHSGGGGEISLLRGNIFEKAAVNWSCVQGDSFPGDDAEGPFFATGISLITHMKNPHAPTVHMNLRYIETPQKSWFGGGYDLTPMGFPYEEDAAHFHAVAKQTLDPFGPDLYPHFSKWAKKYFFISHRQKERGMGGIFFDHYQTDNLNNDFEMWTSVGKSFLNTIIPILEKRIFVPYTEDEKKIQLEYRGHYAEFNLIEDRGTRFGLKSGGNIEAIFCSLPPLASW